MAADTERALVCGPYELVVDDILEDLAGNSVTRVFDHDRTGPTFDMEEKRSSVTRFFPL